MSFLAPLLPAAGLALGGLFGGGGKSAPQVNYTPPGFNAGGLNATFGGNGYTVTPSSNRTSAVGGIASTFGQQAGDIAGLRSQFAPGFSALRSAQLGQINSNRTAAIGNLQQNLQNRRVLGSSFAQDAINRTQAQYDQQQQQVIAQTYLQELAANQQLIQDQYTAARGVFQTGLNEMNLEAGLAADLTGKASSALQNAATTQAQLDAQNAAGQGKFFGGLGQMVGSGLSSMLGGAGGLGGLFGGSGAALTTGAETLGAGSTLVSSAADLLPMLALSDRRQKEDVSKVGKLENGLPVYLFKYKGSDQFQIGLMAQDVEKVNDSAVTEISGVKYVDYKKAVTWH